MYSPPDEGAMMNQTRLRKVGLRRIKH